MDHPTLDLLPRDDTLPAEVDTVVIGGGIVGTCTALTLAERGQRVALCEKGEIAAEQSCRNWGWVRRMGRAVAEYPLGIHSLDLWAGMNARLGAETGFTRSGILYAAETEAEMTVLEGYRRDAEAFGLPTRMLDQAGYADRMTGVQGRVLGALLTEDDGRAEPSFAAPAVARAVRRLGGHVLTCCAVRSIETEAGVVCGVVTEHGPIRCRAAVLAGGAWSRLFAGNLGIGLPVLKVKGSVLRTAPLAGGPEAALGNGAFGLRRRRDGGYNIAVRNRSQAQITPDSFLLFPHYLGMIARDHSQFTLQFGRTFWDDLGAARHWAPDAVTPFERTRILNPAPSDRLLARARAEVERRFPAFAGLAEVERWAGIIDATPDGVPVIGPAPLPGLVIATGFSGHGFGIGPGAGQLAAEMVLGETPCVDPAPFALSRFGAVRRPDGRTGLRAA
ncbi:NAD(P)/FAD-dependent oxidoreductase [Acidimangrovimonas sediminis]|uniref:NAD(P)/FAD-dependent oxidoreductase n=1 Tax=Acidimangrovimonas sediminis TaxID=2056283 RepID=UPI000C80F505|nr:FAD-binding oxidoreductase [Acidimangrovimonas sediminis]